MSGLGALVIVRADVDRRAAARTAHRFDPRIPRPCSSGGRENRRFRSELLLRGARVLDDIHLKIRPNQVTALIGPSGCGKSTFLRTLNRMNDIVPGARVEGVGHHRRPRHLRASVDVVDLRRRVGMVFQKSNPFPKSIFDNVAYGLRINRMTRSREELRRPRRSEPEIGGALGRSAATGCTLGAGAVRRPAAASVHRARARRRAEILLMDEPASALDPIATQRIEELIYQLKAAIRSSSSRTTCSRRRASRT